MIGRKFIVIFFAVALVIGAVGSAYATSGYFNDWKAAYPSSASASFSCSLCHTSAPELNGYGEAAMNANFSFTSLASQDSDGDGSSNITEINAGTNPGDAGSKPAPAPVACTGYAYSAWSDCDSNGQQTRTVAGNTPSGCTGTPSTSPVLTQACTPAPVACTGYAYSAWSDCDSNGQQTRTVAGNTPSGCTGTPSTSPVLTQACNYVPPTPPPTGQTMPVPTSDEIFSYAAVDQPVVSSDPAQAKPIGVGPVATGENAVDVKVNVGPFAGPVNVSFVIFAPAVDSDDLYFMNSHNELKRLSKAVEEDEQCNISGQDSNSGEDHDGGNDSKPSTKFSRLIRWKDNVTGVNQEIFAGSMSDFRPGVYTLVLVARSAENNSDYYRWTTQVTIPQSNDSDENRDDEEDDD